MKKKKKKNIGNYLSWIIPSILILALIILIILFLTGVLNFPTFSSQSTIVNNYNVTPSTSNVFSTCSQLCSSEGFSNSISADSVDDCSLRDTFIKYGSLLSCCCWHKETECTDTDGRDRYTPGWVTYDGNSYYDDCLDVGSAVTEYTCVNGNVFSENLACDYGEECIQTRSGGYCNDIVPTWSPGDTVWNGGGSASVIGTSPQTSSIDLSDYGIETGGTCRLGVQFSTSWNYANDKCVGVPGSQGVLWEFYDSNGLEYSRLDASPIGLGVDLHPESHILNWDGQTNWVAIMTPSPFPFPECSITYEWTARIYIYDC